MKKNRFTERQIIGVLRGQEAGAATAEVCRRHGITEQTFYRWKAKSGEAVSANAKFHPASMVCPSRSDRFRAATSAQSRNSSSFACE